MRDLISTPHSIRSIDHTSPSIHKMTSTGIERPGAGSIRSIEKYDETPMARGVDDEVPRTYSPGDDDSLKPVFDNTHRKLKPRHIQLIGIGGYVIKGRRYIQGDYAE